MPAKIAVMRDSTLAWPRTENSASLLPHAQAAAFAALEQDDADHRGRDATWMISSTSRRSCKKPLTASICVQRLGGDAPTGIARQAGASSRFRRALAMAKNSSALRLAPPTRAPSTSPTASSSRGIAALHRAAIENADPGRLAASAPPSTSRMMRVGSRRRPARSASCRCRSPRPAHRRRPAFAARRAGRHAALELAAEHLQRLAGLALGQVSPTQTIGSSPARQRRLGLGAHDGVGLAAIGAPLGMADDHVAGAAVAQHLGGDVAGMGAACLGVAVLAADQHAACPRRPRRPPGPASPAGRPARRGRVQPACFTPSATPLASASASARRPFIFQLPAISGRLVRAMKFPGLCSPACLGTARHLVACHWGRW